MMTDRNGVSYVCAVFTCVCYTLVCWYTVGNKGTLEPTLIMLLAFRSLFAGKPERACTHTYA